MEFIFFLFATSWIWLPLLLIVIYARSRSGTSTQQTPVSRDQLWLDYLGSFRSVVKTKKEKELIETLIAGRSADTLYGASTPAPSPDVPDPPAVQAQQVPPQKVGQPLDNTIVLLYFGAFLLVASVGLFVALGELDGMVRTIIVALMAAVLYVGGLGLYSSSKKLKQAGVSFMGTGMIVAPLTGVAFYNLVADQTNGGIIWLTTSVVCIALYIHAYSRVQHDFMGYLLIGSVVSAVESSVLAFALPAFGYAWGALLAAIGLAVVHRKTHTSHAAATSAHLLVPLGILGSLALITEHSLVQLSVTLLLSAVYYGLLAWWQPENRATLSVAAQSSFIAAVSSLTFTINESLSDVGAVLACITVTYGALIYRWSEQKSASVSIAPASIITATAAILVSIGDGATLSVAMGATILLSLSIWIRQASQNALAAAGLIGVILPFVLTYGVAETSFYSLEQLLLSVISSLLLVLLVVVTATHDRFKQFYNSAAGLLLCSAAALYIPAAFYNFTALCFVTLGLVATFILFRVIADDTHWLTASGIVTFIPLFYALVAHGIGDTAFAIGTGIALAWNLGLSLVTRHSTIRWMVVLAILIAPLALGGGALGVEWRSAGFAGGYLLALASCLLARAIARGKIMLSGTVPVSSYYREASQAYVAGYIVAGIMAVLISLNDDASQTVTTAILGGISLAVLVAVKIEQRTDLLAILPLLLQGIIVSGFRPDLNDGAAVSVTALAATLAAVASYALARELKAPHEVNLISVISAYIGPALILLSYDATILMPFSLLLAGLTTFHYNMNAQQQSSKELSLIPAIASVHWILFIQDVSNIHVHTHVLAVILLGFALWRSAVQDKVNAANYLKSIFFVVTVPLALASLGSESGSQYGLILILEQVLFILAGAVFNQRFMLTWGLWTALAAILFQLRGLGWAFLTLLAVIVIGIAVYRLQRHSVEQ